MSEIDAAIDELIKELQVSSEFFSTANLKHPILEFSAPEGVDYFLARKFYKKDEPDNERIPQLMQEGWTFVPPDRHLNCQDQYSPILYHKDCIEWMGCILMERPKNN